MNNVEPIEKLSQFTEFVESLPKGFILSRGQAQSFELFPSALRLDKNDNRKYSRAAAQFFLANLKLARTTMLSFQMI